MADIHRLRCEPPNTSPTKPQMCQFEMCLFVYLSAPNPGKSETGEEFFERVSRNPLFKENQIIGA